MMHYSYLLVSRAVHRILGILRSYVQLPPKFVVVHEIYIYLLFKIDDFFPLHLESILRDILFSQQKR